MTRRDTRPRVDVYSLGVMLLYSVRYAMGRMSTAPTTVAGLVRSHWSEADERYRVFLIRDVREELDRCERMGELLGHQCDHDTWREPLAWMEARV